MERATQFGMEGEQRVHEVENLLTRSWWVTQLRGLRCVGEVVDIEIETAKLRGGVERRDLECHAMGVHGDGPVRGKIIRLYAGRLALKLLEVRAGQVVQWRKQFVGQPGVEPRSPFSICFGIPARGHPVPEPVVSGFNHGLGKESG